MKLEESDKLKQDIKTLDVLLIKGYTELQKVKRRAWDSEIKQDNKKLNAYIEELNKIFRIWAETVLTYLKTYLPDKYYFQYHFLSHKSDGLSYVDINIQVNNIFITWENYLRNLEEIIFRLEDARNLQVRREIAEIENKADIAYEIKYSDHSREIKLNNIVIAKPDFESENDRFFNYVYTNPNKPMPIKEIEDFGNDGDKFKKRVTDIVRDLGFKGKLRQIFFPVVSQDKVMFVNPISKKQVIEDDLPAINLTHLGDSGRNRESKRGKTTKR
jgi:hypothetical protein